MLVLQNQIEKKHVPPNMRGPLAAFVSTVYATWPFKKALHGEMTFRVSPQTQIIKIGIRLICHDANRNIMNKELTYGVDVPLSELHRHHTNGVAEEFAENLSWSNFRELAYSQRGKINNGG